MTVVEALLAALNAHDVDAAAALFDEDYHSEQPAHPGRSFVGRAQMHANWAAMFAGIPDFHAEVVRTTHDDDRHWIEWDWSGTRLDGLPFHVRGVTIFQERDGLIVDGRLYVEDVETELVSIDAAVEELSGQRPATSGIADAAAH